MLKLDNMGCNCKVNSRISKFYKKYGYETEQSWKEKISFGVTNSFKKTSIVILTILSLPLILIFLIVLFFFTKRHININKVIDFLLKYRR